MRLVLLCVLAAVVSGCRKKSSPEFYELESAQDILVTREGEDAFGTPEMAALVVRLEAIPENAIEKPRALALAARLTAEKERVAAEKAEAARLAAERTRPKYRSTLDGDPPPPATGPSRRFLCEWTGERYKGCLLGNFTSVQAAERACTGGVMGIRATARCSCGDNFSPADLTLCEQMIAAQKR